ncbi:hypothetical protein CGI09_27950 [Vibrio parahaemolyticus]|nr:hypothetical protein CGI09_27950 [Vibrio parahaemolyticus]
MQLNVYSKQSILKINIYLHIRVILKNEKALNLLLNDVTINNKTTRKPPFPFRVFFDINSLD